MISLVLQQIEGLQADLETIDPAHMSDASEKVAAMAVALRDTLTRFERSRAPAEVEDAHNRMAL